MASEIYSFPVQGVRDFFLFQEENGVSCHLITVHTLGLFKISSQEAGGRMPSNIDGSSHSELY